MCANVSTCDKYKNELVISGISGRFPESNNIEELSWNLFNGVDMVTEDDRRWTPGLGGLPRRLGKLKELNKFDAQYFSVHPRQAHVMDPQLRILLEVTHEAIFDAGINPMEIRGSKTGVFIGTSSSESEMEFLRQNSSVTKTENMNKYTALGCHRAMFSNRISFAFDFKGPSFTVDTACSSSLVAMEQAVTAIQSGHCDSAIVGGVHICLDPKMSLQYYNLNMLSKDGKCKSFDASANGYVRSEAVVAIFIQRKSSALRLYANILAVKTNVDGFKAQGVTFPSGQMQQVLLEEIYKESGVSPSDVSYIEAHGTGTLAGDPQELNAISAVLCNNRNRNDTDLPLLVGSVKSNLGHTEPAAGLCAIAKILLIMENGIIPGNLHYKEPNPNIPALLDGRLKVVTQNTKFTGEIIACNSFGFGGANVHVILKRPEIAFKHEEKCQIPLIIPFSGRTEESILFAFKNLSKNGVDDLQKQMPLLQNIARSNNPGHPFRGFSIISPATSTESIIVHQQISPLNEDQLGGEAPSIWFIFSGMGSQWAWHDMIRDLMKFKVIENSLQKSANILKKVKGPDLFQILLNKKNTPTEKYTEVLNTFVSIASIQVALVDLLKSINVIPSGIIGHSVGELVSAYADSCFSTEETILCAWARGRAILESKSSDPLAKQNGGKMAAVGLNWEEAQAQCPSGIIFPACHNAKGSVTISGPAEDISNFVTKLENEGIFAKEVNSSGMAFHSPYISHVEPKLRELLETIIQHRGNEHGVRSSRWISSSIPEAQWSSELAKFSSVDYHVNNLLSPVLFKEALAKIPAKKNVIVIEIGPHCLLQSLLKRELPLAEHIPLVNKNSRSSHVQFLIKALGEIFNSGLNLDFQNLYSPVQFPVTVPGSLSSLVQWDHSQSWTVAKCSIQANDQKVLENSIANTGEIEIEISLEREEDKFYRGHLIDDRLIFPATGYICLVWKAFARTLNKNFQELPIILENFKIFRATILPEPEAEDGDLNLTPVKFIISIFRGTGDFQIVEKQVIVASGKIRELKFTPQEIDHQHFEDFSQQQTKTQVLDRDGIYKELRLRGYGYSGEFIGIQEMGLNGQWSLIEWMNNWVSYLDTFLHFTLLSNPTRNLYVPTHLDRAIINPLSFLQYIEEKQQQKKSPVSSPSTSSVLLPVIYDSQTRVVSCPGIQFQRLDVGLVTRKIKRAKDASASLILEKYAFVPYFDDNDDDDNREQYFDDQVCLGICLDIILENIENPLLKMVEILVTSKEISMAENARKIVLDRPSAYCDATVISMEMEMKNEKNTLPFSTADEIQMIQIPIQSVSTDESSEICHAGIQKLKRAIEENPVDLILTHQFKTLKEMSESIKNETFILLCSVEKMSQDALEFGLEFGLQLIAHKISRNLHNFYLFRKMVKNPVQMSSISIQIDLMPKEPSASHPFDYNYSWIEELKIAMENQQKNENKNSRIILVSKETCKFPSGLIGLINCLRKEPGGKFIRSVLILEPSEKENESETLNVEVRISSDLLMNVYQNGRWGSYRHLPLFQGDKPLKRSVTHAHLNFTTRGDFSSAQWIESPLKDRDTQKAIEFKSELEYEFEFELCTINFASINAEDVALISGQIPLDSIFPPNPNNLQHNMNVLGREFSGTDSTGKRVMGVLPHLGGFATSVLASPDLLWNFPDYWTLEMAASIPLFPYSIATYAMNIRGQIKNGESILLCIDNFPTLKFAAISIAINLNCILYTTADSEEEKDFLLSKFPSLSQSSFVDKKMVESSILHETNGKGVDVLLSFQNYYENEEENDDDNDLVEQSRRSLSPQGQFLEIVQFASVEIQKPLPIHLKNITHSRIELASLFHSKIEREQIQKLVQDGIKTGIVQPLPFTTFATDNKNEIEKAFKYAQTSKMKIEKTLLQIKATKTEEKIKALPRTYFNPRKCYIIFGGLGGIGLELCGFLIERGARHIALVSRSGVRTGFQKYCLQKWTKHNKNIIITTPILKDVDFTLEGTLSFLRETVASFNGCPIGGIFNLAMVLEDGLMYSQTPEKFQAVSRPKVNITIALDNALRILDQEKELENRNAISSLDYFIIFSSVSSGRGAAGLTNYAWANSVTERICEKRRADGFPALAVQFGPVGDVGRLQDEMKLGHEAIVGGTLTQRIRSVLDTLDIFMDESVRNKHSPPILASSVIPPKNYKQKSKSSFQSKKKDGKSQIRKLSLLEKFGNILGLSFEEMKKANPGKKLVEVGLDSLMGLEIKQLVEQTTGVVLRPVQMLQLTFGQLQEMEESSSTQSPSENEAVQVSSLDIENERDETPEKIESKSKSSNGTKLHANQIKEELSFSRKEEQIKLSSPQKQQRQFKNSPEKNQFSRKILSLLFYFLTFFSLIILAIFAMFSKFLWKCIQIYMTVFSFKGYQTSVKLMSRPYDQYFAHSSRPANMLFILKLAGIPNRSNMIKILNDRVINCESKKCMEKDADACDFYKPYDSLRWRIQKGFLFYSWVLDVDFDVENHIIFEELPSDLTFSLDLDQESKTTAEYYHGKKWEENKPQWEIKILWQKGAEEFLMIFASHHSYGDAISVLNMFQYALADTNTNRNQQQKIPVSLSNEIERNTEKEKENQSGSTKLFGVLQITYNFLQEGHKSLLDFSNVWLDYLQCKDSDSDTDVSKNPEGNHTFCGYTKLNLTKFKSIRNKTTGFRIPMTTVVLFILSRVYERIYDKWGKGEKMPKKLLLAIAYAIFPDKKEERLEMANNVVHAQLGLDLELELINSPYSNTEDNLILLQNRLERATRPYLLKVAWWIFSRGFSSLAAPLMTFFARVMPSPSILYTNVPVNITSNSSSSGATASTTTYFGGYEILDFYGYSAIVNRSHATVATCVNSINNQVTLSLVVDKSAIKICPDFLEQFFSLFHEELDRLVEKSSG